MAKTTKPAAVKPPATEIPKVEPSKVAKLIIYIDRGAPQIAGHTIGDFKWSEKHRAHIYHGKEFEPSHEFNAAVINAHKIYYRLYLVGIKAVDLPPTVPGAPGAKLATAQPERRQAEARAPGYVTG